MTLLAGISGRLLDTAALAVRRSVCALLPSGLLDAWSFVEIAMPGYRGGPQGPLLTVFVGAPAPVLIAAGRAPRSVGAMRSGGCAVRLTPRGAR